MDFIANIDAAIEKVQSQKTATKEELDRLEKDFADVKLNPYGITNIDFNKRMELAEDLLKMEGCIMGLNLAKETYEGASISQ